MKKLNNINLKLIIKNEVIMKNLTLTISMFFMLVAISSGCSQNSKDEKNSNETSETLVQMGQKPEQTQGDNPNKISKPDNPNPPELEIPDWAKPLGLTFPENMKFISGKSSRSSYANSGQSVNSINYVFEGTYEQAMKEAERIAKIMNVPMDENFKNAKIQQNKMKEDLLKSGQPLPPHIPEMKGAIYSNYISNPDKMKNVDYRKSVIAEEGGRLIIILIDNQQIQKR